MADDRRYDNELDEYEAIRKANEMIDEEFIVWKDRMEDRWIFTTLCVAMLGAVVGIGAVVFVTIQWLFS